MKKGDKAVLLKEINQGPTGDTPAFLFGNKGELVEITRCCPNDPDFQYSVTGPTNPGKSYWVKATELEQVTT